MSSVKWKKFARGAGIAAAGAVLAYMSSVIIPDLEAAGLVTISMIASSVVNLAKLAMSRVDSDE